jgi:hypothetical protein
MDEIYFNRSSRTFLKALRTFPMLYCLTQKQLFEKVIADMQNGSEGINPDLLRSYAQNLRNAVAGVTDSPNYGNKYFELQQKLQANVSRFAAHKAFLVSQQIDRARTGNGEAPASPEEFQKKAKAILATFERYQVAEYNTATARSRTARQWMYFDEDKSVPNIRWIATRSADPRPDHADFAGIILPKDSPFWNQNQPGNLWNCKCDWEETTDPVNTKAPTKSTHANGLEGNPGRTGEIFSKEATYFKITKNHEAAVQNDILSLKEKGYFSSDISGAKVNINILHNPGEIAGNIETLTAFLKERNDVKQVSLLPIISPENIAQRANFYPAGKLPRGKYQNADAVIEFKNNEKWVVDFKAMKGSGGKLKDRLKESYEQADYAIIKIKEKSKVNEVTETADRFMRQHHQFKGLMIFDDKGNEIFSRLNRPK